MGDREREDKEKDKDRRTMVQRSKERLGDTTCTYGNTFLTEMCGVVVLVAGAELQGYATKGQQPVLCHVPANTVRVNLRQHQDQTNTHRIYVTCNYS